jgi:PTS system nitrogen regulatory IIA component
MQIKDFLAEGNTAIDVRASDKSGVLRALSTRAATALNLPPQVVAGEIEKRDELGSTGIGGGVSIPHARFREVTKPFGLFVRLRQPIEFQAIDSQPVDLVFLLLLPASSQLDQLNALAAVARKLRDPDTLRGLRAATSATALYRAIAE